MSKLSILSRQTWLRSFFVSTLAFFMVVGVVFGATTISSNIETDGVFTSNTGNSIHYGTTGLYGDAASWDPTGNNGFWFEHGGDGSEESAGMYADDDTLVLWSPGDANILNIYDEDDLPSGDPLFVINGGGWVGILTATPDAALDVGGGSNDYMDGDDDVLIADDLEVDGHTYLEGNVYTYGPTSIGDSAIEAHTVTGIMTFNNNIFVNGNATLGSGGDDSITITDADWSITNPGVASFTGLNVAGPTELDGDVDLGDISGIGMIFELSVSTNDLFIGGGGSGTIQIGNGGGDGVTLGGGGDQINIGDGTDQVNISTGNGVLTVGSGSGITDIYHATADLNFGSIATSDCAELTMTVTGAGVGDTIFLGPPSNIENDLTWSGYVSGVNTVTVRVCNMNASSAIDPASATWAANTFLME